MYFLNVQVDLATARRAISIGLVRPVMCSGMPAIELIRTDCGTGAGGFKKGNKCATGKGSVDVDETDRQKTIREWAEKRFKNPEHAKNFIAWFGDSGVVDENGEPLILMHGTNADFLEFSEEMANPESDLGAGIYLTNDIDDVDENYAGLGPDMTQKIDMEAERLMQDMEYGDAEIPGGITSEEFKELSFDEQRAIALGPAKVELGIEHGGSVIPAFVKMENPVELGGDNETFFETEFVYEDAEGRSPGDVGFDEDTSDIVDEQGSFVEFSNSFNNVASRYHDVDVGRALGDVEGFEGVSATELMKRLKASEGLAYATDDHGKLVSNEILRQTFEEMGFDGFIDRTVNVKFGSQRKTGKSMAGVDYETVHFVAFDSVQVKSAIGNNGDFSDDPRIDRADCGTGKGGFKKGNDCAKGGSGSETKSVTTAKQAWHDVKKSQATFDAQDRKFMRATSDFDAAYFKAKELDAEYAAVLKDPSATAEQEFSAGVKANNAVLNEQEAKKKFEVELEKKEQLEGDLLAARSRAEMFDTVEANPQGNLTDNLISENGNQALIKDFHKDIRANGGGRNRAEGDGSVMASGEVRSNIKNAIVEAGTPALENLVTAENSAAFEQVDDHGGTYDPSEIARYVGDQEPRTAAEHSKIVNQKLLDSWASSSTNGNATSIAMQKAAALKFGDDTNIHATDNIGRAGGDAMYADNKEVFDSYVDDVYTRTQAKLEAAGVDKVTLFRGMRIGKAAAVSGTYDLDMNPLSSYSTDFSVASQFSTSGHDGDSVVMMVEVPRKQIWSTATTGPGCLSEGEVIVLGNAKTKGTMVKMFSPITGRIETLEQFLEATKK